MDKEFEEINVSKDYLEAFNYGYKLGQTKEGRDKAKQLDSVNEQRNIIYLGIRDGVMEAMKEDLKKSLTDLKKRSQKR